MMLFLFYDISVNHWKESVKIIHFWFSNILRFNSIPKMCVWFFYFIQLCPPISLLTNTRNIPSGSLLLITLLLNVIVLLCFFQCLRSILQTTQAASLKYYWDWRGASFLRFLKFSAGFTWNSFSCISWMVFGF